MAAQNYRYLLSLTATLIFFAQPASAEIPEFGQLEKCLEKAIKEELKVNKPHSDNIVKKCRKELDSLLAILPKEGESDPRFANQAPLIIGKDKGSLASTK